MTHHHTRLAALPTEQLEEHVVFAEWRALRGVSARSLGRTRALMDVLGYDPQAAPHRTIGVVGSKGKGTACAYASAALAGLGHRVGTVMSPGVLSNADRIRMDGLVLESQVRRRLLLRIAQGQAQLPPATAETGYLAPTGLFLLMGFLAAAEAGCEVLVAEAGIGGASDDLSQWSLDAVVVTGIFAEHLDLLGPTVANIARNKAAVITTRTQLAVCCPQTPEVAEVIAQRCAETGTELAHANHDAGVLIPHLPEGFQRQNAAAGITAALRLSRSKNAAAEQPAPATSHLGAEKWQNCDVAGAELPPHPDLTPPMSHNMADLSPPLAHRVQTVLASVRYPGRLSVHEVPDAASRSRCAVDSAVSGAGLRVALDFADQQLNHVDQVLVCLPPGKDLAGFIAELEGFPGQKVFVELPGAYTGTPDRSEWPTGPGWGWLRLADLGAGGVHEAEGSDDLLDLLRRGDSLAVGTVLFTSLVLRSLRADAEALFTLL
ncbi:folylpolyglutamate synthase/dihydrofolate synthase family protein [Nesterenkonia ebinurensis]|uniref:hypothetical protein n=1 Tax=Nesterenkonia ebinurensis TaxID=2608252 RepID=UPI00123DC9C8|nr:hypothetical protein [Nesterenkonia ebinurensis]